MSFNKKDETKNDETKKDETKKDETKKVKLYHTNESYYAYESYIRSNRIHIQNRDVAFDWVNKHAEIYNLLNEGSWKFPENILTPGRKSPKTKKKKAHSGNKTTVNQNTVKQNTVKQRAPSPTSIWKVVKKIRYYDKDEYKMSPRNISGKLTRDDCSYILGQLDTLYFNELRDSLDTAGVFATIEESDEKNIMTHIVLKGNQFYEGIKQCPEIALYLSNQFYPAYDWLTDIAGSR
jgi:hypothetical protein